VLKATILSPPASFLPDKKIAGILDISIEEAAAIRAHLAKIPRE